jgi:hypothetical protein
MSNDLVLVKSLPGQNPQILADVHKSNFNGNWYSVKIVVLDAHIQVYVNDSLTIDYQDNSSPILFGKVGVSGMLQPQSTISFDNVHVTSFTDTPPYSVYLPAVAK